MTVIGTGTRTFQAWIGGEARDTPKRLAVRNPATGEVFAGAPDCTAVEVDDAMRAARDAFAVWSQDPAPRKDALALAAAAVTDATDELAELLTTEQGKPRHEARSEIEGAAIWLHHYADADLPIDVLEDNTRAHSVVIRRPLGVVSGITPWNFPVLLACWKIGPALAAGNTMALKPSPYTPLTTLALGQVLGEVLPAGVLNVLSGGDELGALLVSHPTPRKVSFTGSVSAGQQVGSTAVADLKRITLELGGNDAGIVLDDADLDAIAERLFWGAFFNNGQVCSAIKRLFVPAAMHDAAVEALVAVAASVRVGDGLDPATQLGPLNNPAQLRRVQALTEDARSRGATIAAGGSPLDRPGWFFEPTLVTAIDDEAALVAEEQFGPVLPILPYHDVDEAVKRANATTYGLSGSVWGTDLDRASAVAARLNCGTAWVNAHIALSPRRPSGGHKYSGIGVENGTWGLDSFTDLQVVHTSRR